MKKRYKILISVAILTTIILGLNYSGFCFREFKYLSDDELIKNYLDSSFIFKVEYDDYGGLPPKFYFIEENPTTYEIFKTLEHIVNNDVNTTVKIKSTTVTGYNECMTTKSLNIFEALKKYYTIREVTNEVVINGHNDKNGKYIHRYVDMPINQALIVANGDMYMSYIYGKDSFKIDKKNKNITMNLFGFGYNFIDDDCCYEIVNGIKGNCIGGDRIEKFKKYINSELEYFKKYKKMEEYEIEITNCGMEKDN